MGFKLGVKERRVMDGESEDTENDEVMCAMWGEQIGLG